LKKSLGKRKAVFSHFSRKKKMNLKRNGSSKHCTMTRKRGMRKLKRRQHSSKRRQHSIKRR